MHSGGSLDDLIDKAFGELLRIHQQTDAERTEWLKEMTSLPPTIPLGDGGNVLTTQLGLDSLHEFGRRWRRESEKFKAAIGEKEAAQLTVRVVGEILAGVGTDDYSGNPSIKAVLKDRLRERLEAITGSLSHYFPLQVFDANLPSFSVGPVIFLVRLEWLEKVEGRAGRALAWAEAVRNYWSGQGPKPESPRLKQERMPGMDEWTAYNTVQSFGESTWAAIVEVPEKERQRSKECSEIAVRVALDSIGLALALDDARGLRGPGDQKQRRIDRHFSQSAGLDISYSSRMDLPRFKTAAENYSAFLEQTEELRGFAGKALHSFIGSGLGSGKDELHRRWVEAMYWYGQAVREPMDFIGLVNVGVTLDVLAKGSKARGITKLCTRLMGVDADTIVTQNGMSVEKLVKAIFDDGRSQFSHGGRLGLLSDLPFPRDVAVEFSSLILSEYAAKLSIYIGPDTYEDFLDFLSAPPTAAAPK